MDNTPLKLGAGDQSGITFGSALIRYIKAVVTEQVRDLADLFPLTTPSFRLREVRDTAWVGFIVTGDVTTNVPSVSLLRGTEAEELKAVLAPLAGVSAKEQGKALVDAGLWTSVQFACVLTFIGPQDVSWRTVQELAVEWLNTAVTPDVEQRNRARVLRALPPAPRFDFSSIAASLVVLESEESASQGTGFFLEGVGIVTCEHVLAEGLKAFVARPPFTRSGVQILRRNSALDLAVLKTDRPLDGIVPLKRGEPKTLRILSAVAAVGFPNYRLGDTGTIMPGVIVGFRPVKGVRRLMTNATIVSGMSGGPVVIDSNTVVGIAVTGADKLDMIEDTEDRGVIPIDALELLL